MGHRHSYKRSTRWAVSQAVSCPNRDLEHRAPKTGSGCHKGQGVNPLEVSALIFLCIFGGAMAGIWLRQVLPEHYLDAETKDLVKLGVGLIGTMAALLLGLLVASAKSAYDARSSELTQVSANTILLDRMLAHYGPETDRVRADLRAMVARTIDQIWPKSGQDGKTQFAADWWRDPLRHDSGTDAAQ